MQRQDAGPSCRAVAGHVGGGVGRSLRKSVILKGIPCEMCIRDRGNHAKRSEASWLEMASVFCSMGTANFWKGKMAE